MHRLGSDQWEKAKRRAADRIETLYGRGLFSRSAGETMIVAFSDRAALAPMIPTEADGSGRGRIQGGA